MPKFDIPDTLNVPATFTPVPVNVTILEFPATPTVTFPPELVTVTLLVPLLMLATLVITPVSKAPLPKK